MRRGDDLERFISFRVPHETHAALHRLAEQQEQSVSELLRECVEIIVESDREKRRKVNPFVQAAKSRRLQARPQSMST